MLPTPVRAGDTLIGLSSSGVHSNGFSLVRKVIEVQKLDYTAEAPFQAGVRLCDALLTPTKIYVKALMPAIRAGIVAAMAHITGGGLVEVRECLRCLCVGRFGFVLRDGRGRRARYPTKSCLRCREPVPAC